MEEKEKKMIYLPVETIDKVLDYIEIERKQKRKTNFSEIVDKALIAFLKEQGGCEDEGYNLGK